MVDPSSLWPCYDRVTAPSKCQSLIPLRVWVLFVTTTRSPPQWQSASSGLTSESTTASSLIWAPSERQILDMIREQGITNTRLWKYILYCLPESSRGKGQTPSQRFSSRGPANLPRDENLMTIAFKCPSKRPIEHLLSGARRECYDDGWNTV